MHFRCVFGHSLTYLNILYHNIELDEYIGCFVEDGPEACEGEINVRMIYVYLYVLTFLHMYQQLVHVNIIVSATPSNILLTYSFATCRTIIRIVNNYPMHYSDRVK